MRQQYPRALGVLLCYNDADVLKDVIDYLIQNNHHIVAWDHGSDDGTAEVLDSYGNLLLERRFVPRSFDFYRLYQAMSEHLIQHYIRDFDWISWPDQDEILEGPDRAASYYDYLTEVYHSPYDWIRFHNYNYWVTPEDDPAIASPIERVRHYALFPDCAPRIRSWRATATNVREFNHNPPKGEMYPVWFNLRHYPMRSYEQMERRLSKDRSGLQRGGANYHYENMKARQERLHLSASQLHRDDGRQALDPTPVIDWRSIYGHGPLGAT